MDLLSILLFALSALALAYLAVAVSLRVVKAVKVVLAASKASADKEAVMEGKAARAEIRARLDKEDMEAVLKEVTEAAEVTEKEGLAARQAWAEKAAQETRANAKTTTKTATPSVRSPVGGNTKSATTSTVRTRCPRCQKPRGYCDHAF